MIAYDLATKVIDTELFPQHSIAALNLWHYNYCFVQSGEAFTVKGHTHTHIHILAANRLYFETFISNRQNFCVHYH